jgi:hypothetical protein
MKMPTGIDMPAFATVVVMKGMKFAAVWTASNVFGVVCADEVGVGIRYVKGVRGSQPRAHWCTRLTLTSCYFVGDEDDSGPNLPVKS